MISEKNATAPALLFDFGGVLVDLDRNQVLQSFDELGMDIRPFLGIFSQLEQGRVSIPQFCEALRQLSQCPQVSDEAIVAAWQSFLHIGVPAERLEMLLKIKQHYSVNLLSNTNFVHWRMAQDIFFCYKGRGVNDFFDHIFLSCELGVEKPDPAIFQAVTEGLKLPASHILFFDDSEVNCQAARNCGMQALLAPAGSEWFKYFDENGKLHSSYLQTQP